MAFVEGSNRSTWMLARLLQCIRGPSLRRTSFPGSGVEGDAYEPNKTEKYANNVISAVRVVWSVAIYATPLYLVYYFARYGQTALSGLVLSLARNLSFVPLSFSLAYFVRGIGRYKNSKYNEFLRTLNTARSLTTRLRPEEVRLTGIAQYDFDVSALPVTFYHNESSVRPRRIISSRRRGLVEYILSLPMSSLRCLAAHLVGRRLIYPGSLAFFNAVLSTNLSVGRTKLKKLHNAHRARLQASDGNTIDCMFVDKRGSPDSRAAGNKIVICCEGNAAFYELGMVEVPLYHGYSVIGWNHPGFGDSTGLPFPSQEFNAVDVVMRYVVTELGFAFGDIIVYAWSIGGFTASSVAMSYPDIGAVVIDASFDELYPLVTSRIHPCLHGFCHGMVEEFYNLNIAEQLCRYQGPVRLIRRMRDEMMSVNKDVETNRGNYLLVRLLQNRYPNIVTDETLPVLWKWLKAPTIEEQCLIVSASNMRPQDLSRTLHLYCTEHGYGYPCILGQRMSLSEKNAMLLFLAEQYMTHVVSTHCAPLPVEHFTVPSAGNYNIN